jgi:hypothetical protein
MKHLFHILLFLPIVAFPQGTPQGISYQAVAYDSEGYEISNQDISVRLGILLGGVDAEASYTEVHSVTTDDFGLFSLVISEGVSNDDFSSIDWEEGAFLKIEVDEDLDGEYSVMGVSSFNAVPYALSAPTEARIDSVINLLEYKFDLMNRPLQQSLDQGISIRELYEVGFRSNDLIGLRYQGGLIFYIDSTYEHGLIAAKQEIGHFEWGCVDEVVIGADGIAVGTGLQNSQAIIAQGCHGYYNENEITAAHAALNYESDGYSDWYLPSYDELWHLLYQYKYSEKFKIVGAVNQYTFAEREYYLTSSDSWGNHTFVISTHHLEGHGSWKGSKEAVIPIRSF